MKKKRKRNERKESDRNPMGERRETIRGKIDENASY